MKIGKINVWYNLSLRVILLFVVAMFVSFVPDYFRDFFGDKLIQPDKYGYYPHRFFDETYDWGVRHHFYFWMCVALFIIQGVRIGFWISKNEKEF